MSRAFTIGLGLVLSLSAPGCAEEDIQGSTSACEASSQCEGSLGCAYGYCVEPMLTQVSLQARVLPPPGSPYLQQQVPEFLVGEQPAMTVQLVETVELTGVVRNTGDAFVSNLPGELEARSPGEIPGLNYRFTARSSDGLDASGLGYQLRLLPGRDYEVLFRPDDKSLPPHSFALTAEEVVSGTLDILLPELGEYVKFAGWVQWKTGQPITGCRMTVLLEDGHALPTTTLETVQAAFSLRLPPGTESVRVRVEPAQDGDIFPTFVSEPMAPANGVELTLPSLSAGMAAFDAPIRVVRVDAKGDEIAVAGVNLVLVGSLDAGEVSTTGMTAEDGVALVHVLPGTYEVLVASPPGQDFGTLLSTLTWAGPVDDEATADVKTLTVPNRPLVHGTVFDSTGEPVTAGQVHARRRSEAEPGDAIAIAPPPFVAQLDETGTYAMHLDSGAYDFSVLPEAESGAPPTLLDNLDISETTQLDVDLPPASLAHITVDAPDGTPLPDVTIELYRSDDASTPPRVLVKGTTTSDGVVDLLVPHLP
jgi:hypothetical protein